MKSLFSLFILVFSIFSSVLAQDEAVGIWKLENGIDLQIYKQNDKYFGKIVPLNGFNDGQQLDEHNPDKSLRDKSLIDLVILKDLEYNKEDGLWEDGEMYAPHMGMKANLEIKKVEGNKLTAVARN